MDATERHLRLLTETIEAVNSTLDLDEVLSLVASKVAAAAPVIPSPGRMRGVRVISSTRVPCVARRTSSSARSSYR